jgi:hypothetical protein
MKRKNYTVVGIALILVILSACSLMPSAPAPRAGAASTPVHNEQPAAQPTEPSTPSDAGTAAPGVKTGVLELKKGVDRVEDGFLHIAGEVINHSGVEIGFVRVDLTIKDKSGNILAQDFKYSDLEHVKDGASAPFEYVRDIQKLNGEYASYEATVGAAGVSSSSSPVVKAVSTSASESGFITVKGIFANTAGAACENAYAVATAYNPAGLVVTVEADPLQDSAGDFIKSVEAGKEYAFEFKIQDSGGKVTVAPSCSN